MGSSFEWSFTYTEEEIFYGNAWLKGVYNVGMLENRLVEVILNHCREYVNTAERVTIVQLMKGDELLPLDKETPLDFDAEYLVGLTRWVPSFGHQKRVTDQFAGALAICGPLCACNRPTIFCSFVGGSCRRC